jgi:Putative F0F1-ATPase subunit Ca2+/Mg2+ transporter
VDKSASMCAPGSVTESEPPPGPTGTDEPKPGTDPKPLPGAVAFLNMGLAAAVCVGAGLLLGLWADSAWHTAPILLVVGLVLGLVAAAASVVAQIRKYL